MARELVGLKSFIDRRMALNSPGGNSAKLASQKFRESWTLESEPHSGKETSFDRNRVIISDFLRYFRKRPNLENYQIAEVWTREIFVNIITELTVVVLNLLIQTSNCNTV